MSQVRTNIQTHAPTGGLYSTQSTSLHRGNQREQEAWPIPSQPHERKDTPHSSPSQMGGLLSASTAPLLTTGADLETSTASTLLSLSVKLHLTTVLAGGWSCWAPSGDRFLREGSPGDKQGQELKQGGCENRKSKIDNSHGNG